MTETAEETSLVSTSELCRSHRLGAASVTEYLGELKPTHTAKTGAGIAKFYDRASADALIRKGIEQAARRTRAAEAPAREAEGSALAPRLAAIENIVSDILGNTEQMDEDRAQVKKLLDQNTLIFKAINELRQAFAGRPPILPVPPAPAATAAITPPAAPAPPDAPAKVVKHRVVVAGVRSTHAAIIKQEFGECFNLTTYTSEECKGRSYEDSLGRADHVIAVLAGMNDGFESTRRAAGSKLIRITGGLSTLRDRLTELYIATADKK